jgi:hemolysin activation/secretion protein
MLSGSAFAADEASLSAEAAQDLTDQAEAFRDEARNQLPAVSERPEISEIEKPQIPVGSDEAGPSFYVKEIRFEGNRLLAASEFRALAVPFEQKTLNFAELSKLISAVTREYQSRGFTTSFAYLPPQKIADGIVTVRIIEGVIGSVKVENNRFFSEAVYRRDLGPFEGRTFRYQDLESGLYRLNSQPDRSAKAFLMAGKDELTSDLLLKAEDSSPFHGWYEFNNRGSKRSGRGRHIAHLEHNNFFGTGDQLGYNYSWSEEGSISANSLSYNLPLGDGTNEFNLESSYVLTALSGDLKAADIDGLSWSVTPGYTRHWVRSPAFALDGYMGLDIKDSKTTVQNLKIYMDRMRILKLGPRLTLQDTVSRSFLYFDANIGLPGFMGGLRPDDPNASRPDSGGRFVYYTAGITRIQRLPSSILLILKADGQLADNTLTSSENYRLGGAFTVRGYPESDSLGDSGFRYSAEIETPIPFLHRPEDDGKPTVDPEDLEALRTKPSETKIFPIIQKAFGRAGRLTAFVDGGKTSFKNRSTDSDVKNKSLLGAGGGVKMQLNSSSSVQCQIAQPIGNNSSDEDQTQVHLSAKVGF